VTTSSGSVLNLKKLESYYSQLLFVKDIKIKLDEEGNHLTANVHLDYDDKQVKEITTYDHNVNNYSNDDEKEESKSETSTPNTPELSINLSPKPIIIDIGLLIQAFSDCALKNKFQAYEYITHVEILNAPLDVDTHTVTS
jgi:hypothetical protein